MRLFASLSLPPTAAEHLQMALRSVDASAPPGGGGRPALRWVPTEQRHITLAFYGEVTEGAVNELVADLESALLNIAPFTVRLRGAGVFTGRTLWAGVQETAAEASAPTVGQPEGSGAGLLGLMRLSETVGAGYARQAELVADRQRRRAHVTLARVRDRRRGEAQLRARAEALAVYEGPSWRVSEAQLMLSELGHGKSGGPLYTTLADLQLGG